MLGGFGVGVDDRLGADLVGVAVVLDVVVGHERRRVVDPADLALFADLDLADDGVDRAGRVVDVADRTRRRAGVQVLVVHAVLGHLGGQRTPVVRGGQIDAGTGEQLLHLGRARRPVAGEVLAKELTRGVLRPLEAVEALAALAGDAA